VGRSMRHHWLGLFGVRVLGNDKCEPTATRSLTSIFRADHVPARADSDWIRRPWIRCASTVDCPTRSGDAEVHGLENEVFSPGRCLQVKKNESRSSDRADPPRT